MHSSSGYHFISRTPVSYPRSFDHACAFICIHVLCFSLLLLLIPVLHSHSTGIGPHCLNTFQSGALATMFDVGAMIGWLRYQYTCMVVWSTITLKCTYKHMPTMWIAFVHVSNCVFTISQEIKSCRAGVVSHRRTGYTSWLITRTITYVQLTYVLCMNIHHNVIMFVIIWDQAWENQSYLHVKFDLILRVQNVITFYL